MRGWFLLCSLLATGLVTTPSVRACSCLPPVPPLEALEQADAVFVARVLHVRDAGDERRVTLFVVRAFKGDAGETVDVRTAQNSAACGYPFEKGEDYLVYVDRSGGVWHASLCSRTARLRSAESDLAAFEGAGLRGTEPDGGGRCGGSTNAAALQGILFVLLGTGWIRRRRSRRRA